MEYYLRIILSVIIIATAPLAGGVILGADLFISSRMKGIGKISLFQPFIDVNKLLKKQTLEEDKDKLPFIFGHFIFSLASLALLVFRQDILFIVMMNLLSWIFLLMYGFFSSKISERLASKRGLYMILSCFPVLFAFGGSVYILTGGYTVQNIINFQGNLLLRLPFIFIAVIMVIMIRSGKPPFDNSVSDSPINLKTTVGIIEGLYGKQLALVQVTGWINTAVMYFMIGLFYIKTPWIAVLLAALVFLLQCFMSNIFPKFKNQYIYRNVPVILFGLVMINVLWIALKEYL